ncbi:malonyl-ACP O-methyltransferase BioC [Vibrio salinus]|uniref:malonyl-ACP O-methyltransferase BioC n=1 Tax=Vibrio salinus TaxID=2899784 RepID=UPI001E48282A|nr:malonyl-ACP O-methyltransferase BioC [Vibrio salinus]MCE0496208.1 malonyl-ACP O-methyltransferase BioC [Vibrio salinus]
MLPTTASKPTNKEYIANAFSKAAHCYDRHAQFQRDVADILLANIPDNLAGKRILDLGCGTGYVAKALLERGAHVTCVDISEGMLQVAEKMLGTQQVSYLCADAEQLPIPDGTFDYVTSSLALQWCEDLSRPMTEIKRVLKSDGTAYFSTLLDGSLDELRWSWAQVDRHQHVNVFKSLKRVKLALAQSDIENHQLDLRRITVWYESAIALMKDLKGIGATHVNNRDNGLVSRNALCAVEREYQRFQNSAGLLPATYQVCIGVIRQ